MEAVASEVALLRPRFPSSILWGISPAVGIQLSPQHGFAFNPKLHLLFRAGVHFAQGRYDINHLYGGFGDWFHLRALRRRPSVLTLAVHAPAASPELLSKIDQFVVEWPRAEAQLLSLDIAPERIRLVPPPVDLARFVVRPAPATDFTVLFASAPSRADWLEARGVGIILAAAKLRPEMRFRLLWRPWGDSFAAVTRWVEELDLKNVVIDLQRVDDMVKVYSDAYVTVFPGVGPLRCKPIPNSIIESLACGRPVVVSDRMEIQDFIDRSPGARVVAAKGEALAEALDSLEANWSAASVAARAAAQRSFDQVRFLDAYTHLYAEMLSSSGGPAPSRVLSSQ